MSTLLLSGMHTGLLAAMVLAIALLLHSHYAQLQAEAAQALRQQRLAAMGQPHSRVPAIAEQPAHLYSIVVINLADDEVRVLRDIEGQ